MEEGEREGEDEGEGRIREGVGERIGEGRRRLLLEYCYRHVAIIWLLAVYNSMSAPIKFGGTPLAPRFPLSCQYPQNDNVFIRFCAWVPSLPRP